MLKKIAIMAVHLDFSRELTPDFYADVYSLGIDNTNRGLLMMRREYYYWELLKPYGLQNKITRR